MFRAAARAAGVACLRRRGFCAPLHEGRTPRDSPSLADFMPPASAQTARPAEWLEGRDGLAPEPSGGGTALSVYVESYGCQMNTNDTEVVLSVLNKAGYSRAADVTSADVILLNTCAIREVRAAPCLLFACVGVHDTRTALQGAEDKIWARLRALAHLKKKGRRRPQGAPSVGVLGCMAERLKEKLLETDGLADIAAGPDAYRDLPRLLSLVRGGTAGSAMNVQLSADETYADIVPVRADGAVSAFLSVMRGCNNMCSFCIVPYTRGREHSRPTASVLAEVRALADQGVREVTLLGQNVNSFTDFSERGDDTGATARSDEPFAPYAPGFRSVYVPRRAGAVSFAELLERVAEVDPEMRIRFTSPHPKDFPDEVLRVIARKPNVCKQLHLPAQSGATSVLERMRRGYTCVACSHDLAIHELARLVDGVRGGILANRYRIPFSVVCRREAYLSLAARVREVLPGVALSSDFISGFCGETEAEHADTLTLLREVRYEAAFMFAYSRREKTSAARHLEDDVPPAVKQRRLEEVLARARSDASPTARGAHCSPRACMQVIATFKDGATQRAAAELGRVHCVLVEGPSRRSPDALTGRTDTHKRVVFANAPLPADVASAAQPHAPAVQLRPGDYVAVRVQVLCARLLRPSQVIACF